MKHFRNRWESCETWCVGEMVSNESSGRLWRRRARRHAVEAKARHLDEVSDGKAWHDAVTTLARELSQRLHDANPLPVMDVYSNLLLTALDGVDYVGIAERLLCEFFAGAGGEGAAPDSRELMMFETFTVLRWATCDGDASARWREVARACRDEARRRPAPDGVAPAAASLLSEALRDQVPEVLAGGTSEVRDALFDCALSRVDWWQLARELFRVYGLFDEANEASGRDA